MKFSIENILAGVAAHRRRLLKDGDAALTAAREEIGILERRARVGAEEYQAMLLKELDALSATTAFFKNSEALHGLKELQRHLPYSYAISNQEREVERLEVYTYKLRTATDDKGSKLEEFLRALRAGGETHITQNALKTAGWGDYRISDYIIALERTKKENA